MKGLAYGILLLILASPALALEWPAFTAAIHETAPTSDVLIALDAIDALEVIYEGTPGTAKLFSEVTNLDMQTTLVVYRGSAVIVVGAQQDDAILKAHVAEILDENGVPYRALSSEEVQSSDLTLLFEETPACPAVYEPVCGQPPMPPCPEGLGCALVMPAPKTYGNACELKNAGAAFIHAGQCEGIDESCPAGCSCDDAGFVLSCDAIACPERCTCDASGAILECGEPICGNGVCEPGETKTCAVQMVTCKAGEPCDIDDDASQCSISCPQDCDVQTDRTEKLNEKFKLQVGQRVSIPEADMNLHFSSIAQAGCTAEYMESSNEKSSGGAYPSYPEEVEGQKTAAIVADSGSIMKCDGGSMLARLEIAYGETATTIVSIRLGERKNVQELTVSFLEYSGYGGGVFLVEKGSIACPETCTCGADGSMDCPAEECSSGTMLCPDGTCQKECGIVPAAACSFGCLYGEESCLPIGTRVDGQYCSVSRDLERQQEAAATCENNFECRSNLCIDSQCVEPGVFEKLLRWFRDLF